MNKKLSRIIALVGLGCMAIFSICFVLFLIDTHMGNGVVAFLTLFSGVGGIVCFLIIKLNQKAEKEKEEMEGLADSDSEEEPTESTEPTEPTEAPTESPKTDEIN